MHTPPSIADIAAFLDAALDAKQFTDDQRGVIVPSARAVRAVGAAPYEHFLFNPDMSASLDFYGRDISRRDRLPVYFDNVQEERTTQNRLLEEPRRTEILTTRLAANSRSLPDGNAPSPGSPDRDSGPGTGKAYRCR